MYICADMMDNDEGEGVVGGSRMDDDNDDTPLESDDVIEDLFGCYLLYCQNPKYKGRSYIGFTVNPQRRIKQHNGGSGAGGAWKTSNKGPWAMILLIQGFPNQIAALRFEWAWQHPSRSRRLHHLPPKKSKESTFYYNLRLVSEMLHIGPWKRLPLTVRWLRPDLIEDLKLELTKDPPLHMPIVYGPVKSKKIPGGGCAKHKKKKTTEKSQDENVDETEELICSICFVHADKKERVTCLEPKCSAVSHLTCLANHFLITSSEEDEFIPINGKCPVCDLDALWGDIIRKMKGCYSNDHDKKS